MRLRILTIVVVASLLAACGSCGSNEEAVALARSLSQQRLAKLFSDVQALDLAGQPQLYIDTRTNTPSAFADLQVQSIASDGHTARLHLSGCVDDKVLLVIKGLGSSGRKQVSLLPGEAKSSVVLWQSN